MAAMDPIIKAMAAIKRDFAKHIGTGKTLEEKLMLLQFAETEFLRIRKSVTAAPTSLAAAEAKEIGGQAL